MMRKLKVLGMALVAVFALGAVVASVAAADEFTAESYSVIVTGKQTGTDKIVTTAGTTSCEEINYQGTISAATTSVTLTPALTKCTALGFPATVDVNGCDYTYTVDGGNLTTGIVHLECAAGQDLAITAIAAGTTKCTIHIPPQTFPTIYTNSGSGQTREISILINYSGMKYSHTKGTGLGSCSAGSGTTGSYVAGAIWTGEVDSGSTHIGIFLSAV